MRVQSTDSKSGHRGWRAAVHARTTRARWEQRGPSARSSERAQRSVRGRGQPDLQSVSLHVEMEHVAA